MTNKNMSKLFRNNEAYINIRYNIRYKILFPLIAIKSNVLYLPF